MDSLDDHAPNFFSDHGQTTQPPVRVTPPPTPIAPVHNTSSISNNGQQNKVDFKMVNHPLAGQHLDDARQGALKNFPNQPQVEELSNKMGEDREAYSKANPNASDKDAIHQMQLNDAARQLDAGKDGKITAQQARDLPATSVGPFVKSLLDPDKRPATLRQGGAAIGTAAIGLAGQMLNADAHGDQFSGTLDRVD